MKVHNYENLQVWQKSMNLAEEVYCLTEKFPKTELYGLTSQMRRCAVSIPSNIAEGSRRKTKKDFTQFLSIAFGSVAELETQLKLAERLNLINKSNSARSQQLLSEIMRMLNKFIGSLNSNL